VVRYQPVGQRDSLILRAEGGITLAESRQGIPQDFLFRAGLPPQWTLAQAAACALEVEAALARDPVPLLAGMYADQPDRWSPELAGIDRLRFAVNSLTRLRFVDADGRLLLGLKGPVPAAPAGAIPWFRHAERRTRGDTLVFGHWSALGYLSEPGLRCLDTGCVWGGSLCALRLDRADEPVMLACRGSKRPPGG
jgi:bis(5'-nucleosyl)-tetraphosphatase (symmetrical)